jgi:hypothetical protein
MALFVRPIEALQSGGTRRRMMSCLTAVRFHRMTARITFPSGLRSRRRRGGVRWSDPQGIYQARVVRLCALSAIALPIALVIGQRSTLYDGIRHLLFIYPVLVVLAAGGWTAGLSRRDLLVRRITAVLLVIGFVDILAFDVRAHPNESAYFNQLVGGPKGAFSKYDMDYWGNCVLQAVAWSAKTAQLSGVPVVISGELSQ